jgi:hypothetical protein
LLFEQEGALLLLSKKFQRNLKQNIANSEKNFYNLKIKNPKRDFFILIKILNFKNI